MAYLFFFIANDASAKPAMKARQADQLPDIVARDLRIRKVQHFSHAFVASLG